MDNLNLDRLRIDLVETQQSKTDEEKQELSKIRED